VTWRTHDGREEEPARDSSDGEQGAAREAEAATAAPSEAWPEHAGRGDADERLILLATRAATASEACLRAAMAATGARSDGRDGADERGVAEHTSRGDAAERLTEGAWGRRTPGRHGRPRAR